MSDQNILGECSLCGAPLTIHFYSRGASSPPGNMKVCTDEACRGSVSGMQAMTLEQVYEFQKGAVPPASNLPQVGAGGIVRGGDR